MRQSSSTVRSGPTQRIPTRARRPPGSAPMARCRRFGVGGPRPDPRELFGNSGAARLFDAAIARLAALGGEIVEVDFAPFSEAAALVYGGPWLAERGGGGGDRACGRRPGRSPAR